MVRVEGGVQPMDRGLYIALPVSPTYSSAGEFEGGEARYKLE